MLATLFIDISHKMSVLFFSELESFVFFPFFCAVKLYSF